METLRSAARAFARQPYLVLSLAALGWGGNTIAGRLAVGQISPMAIVTLRWLLVLLVLAIPARRSVMAERELIARHALFLFCMGTLGFTVFNALFYWSARYTSAVNLGVVQGVTPGFVLLGSFVAYRTRVRLLQIVGILISFGGVVVMATRADLEVLRTLAFNIGDVGILIASTLYAGYTVALRDRPPLSPIAFFAAMATAAFVSSLPLLAYEVATGTVIWPDWRGWLIVLFVALGPSLMCQLLYMRGVELIGPGRAGLFMNLIPVIAAVLGVAILGERFAPYHAVALVLVLGGIALAERRAPGG